MWCATAGCRTAGVPSATPGTRLERLIDAYPELRAGRFAIIADFEDPNHFELFHLNNTSGAAGSEPTALVRHGHALRFQVGSGADELIVNNDNATHWYLKRDWRSYDLFLLSVDAPVANLTLHLDVRAGPPDRAVRTEAAWPLERGRNVVRLDLSELGETVPLDDIRALAIRLDGGTGRTTVTVDDLILTQDRAAVLGDASATDGALFVERIGQRWRIGAGGHFELAFAHGQIVAWHDLKRDPHRLVNLVRDTVLGPEPVSATGTSAVARKNDAALVSVRTELLEANPVRAVIDIERRRRGSGRARRPSLAPQHWRYTIYPTGQVFVGVDLVPDKKWADGSFALAVSVTEPEPDMLSTHLLSDLTANAPSDNNARLGASARFGGTGASLVFVPYFGDGPPRIDERRGPSGALTFVATPSTVSPRVDGRVCAAVYLRLVASPSMTDDDAAREAAWFHAPPALSPSVGALSRTDDPCAFARGGLLRRSGVVALVPDGNLVRLTLPETRLPCRAPAFEVLDETNRAAWVYVEYRLHEPTAHTPNGHLLFQTPNIAPRATIEVLFARP